MPANSFNCFMVMIYIKELPEDSCAYDSIFENSNGQKNPARIERFKDKMGY